MALMGAGFSIGKGIRTTVKVFNSIIEKNYRNKTKRHHSFDSKVSNFVVESLFENGPMSLFSFLLNMNLKYLLVMAWVPVVRPHSVFLMLLIRH